MSNTQMRPGGSPSPALSTVATDQTTIRGSGTSFDPLRAIGSTYTAEASSISVTQHRGQPLTGGGVGEVTLARANTEETAACVGISMGSAPSEASEGFTSPVLVQQTGPVELTTDEWDHVTGDTGGLVAGLSYYVSTATAGKLVQLVDLPLNGFKAYVGKALTATRLVLGPSAPIAY